MSKFHVHGRYFRGTLATPTRNDTMSDEFDDRAAAFLYGYGLAEEGYRVWVYERGPCSPMDQPQWSTVAEWDENGDRIR